MTDEEFQAIAERVHNDNGFKVMVDREVLFDACLAYQQALRNIVKILVHGKSVAADIQEAVRLAQEQLGELPTVVVRDCTTDPELP